jgi:hypothetical protein
MAKKLVAFYERVRAAAKRGVSVSGAGSAEGLASNP